MRFQLIDTASLVCDVEETPDMVSAANEMAAKISMSGALAVPIICWQGDYNQEMEEFEFVVAEEPTNQINFLAMVYLYEENPRQWHLTPCWLVDGIAMADLALMQYL